MDRLEANRAILKRLGEVVEANPALRFGQILVAWGVLQTRIEHHNPVDYTMTLLDPFQEESMTTLERLQRHT